MNNDIYKFSEFLKIQAMAEKLNNEFKVDMNFTIKKGDDELITIYFEEEKNTINVFAVKDDTIKRLKELHDKRNDSDSTYVSTIKFYKAHAKFVFAFKNYEDLIDFYKTRLLD